MNIEANEHRLRVPSLNGIVRNYSTEDCRHFNARDIDRSVVLISTISYAG